MKKNICFAFLLSSVLLVGISVSAKVPAKEALSRKVNQKVVTATNNQQVTTFMEQLAKKDPVKLANFLLGGKFTYIYDESIEYVGIRGTDEVLVVCLIADSDVGDFYYVAHKKGNKIKETTDVTPPVTQGFVTLFDRK